MPAYRPYRFDRRFDAAGETILRPDPEAAQAAAAAAAATVDPLDLPRHSDRALQAAIGEAEARGFAAGAARGVEQGTQAAEQRIEARAVELLAELGSRLAGMENALAESRRRVEVQGAAIVIALVRRLAPGLLAATARADAERLVGEALRAAGRSPVLTVTVAPALAGLVRTRLGEAAAAAGRTAPFTVAEDERLVPGALRADWDTGALIHDPAEIEAAIAAHADRALADLTAPSPAPVSGNAAGTPARAAA